MCVCVCVAIVVVVVNVAELRVIVFLRVWLQQIVAVFEEVRLRRRRREEREGGEHVHTNTAPLLASSLPPPHYRPYGMMMSLRL